MDGILGDDPGTGNEKFAQLPSIARVWLDVLVLRSLVVCRDKLFITGRTRLAGMTVTSTVMLTHH